jgi:hypothetical protein
VDVDERSRTLLAAVEALYSRLQSNALTSADLIDPDTLKAPEHNAYLSRVFKDQALFDARFGTFKEHTTSSGCSARDETCWTWGRTGATARCPC